MKRTASIESKKGRKPATRGRIENWNRLQLGHSGNLDWGNEEGGDCDLGSEVDAVREGEKESWPKPGPNGVGVRGVASSNWGEKRNKKHAAGLYGYRKKEDDKNKLLDQVQDRGTKEKKRGKAGGTPPPKTKKKTKKKGPFVEKRIHPLSGICCTQKGRGKRASKRTSHVAGKKTGQQMYAFPCHKKNMGGRASQDPRRYTARGPGGRDRSLPQT